MSKPTWTKEQFINAVKNNFSIAGVLKELNLNIAGAGYKTVKLYVEKFQLNTSHWTGQGHGTTIQALHKHNTQPIENILIANSFYNSTNNLKKRLLNLNMLTNHCYICDQLPIWKEQKLVMVLDHINGDNRDHRIENLRLLCPNCNSQQSTFTGKNIKINRRPKITCTCKNCNKILKQERKTGLCIHCSGILKHTENHKAHYNNLVGICQDCGTTTKGRSNLCPKCSHKKNRIVPERPPYEILLKEIKETNFCAVGRKYGVSDNAIRKWIKTYEKELSKPIINTPPTQQLLF